jgi:hypothetical protein
VPKVSFDTAAKADRPADPFKHPEVKHVAKELAVGYELIELHGRFAARRKGRICFVADDARRLLELTRTAFGEK